MFTLLLLPVSVKVKQIRVIRQRLIHVNDDPATRAGFLAMNALRTIAPNPKEDIWDQHNASRKMFTNIHPFKLLRQLTPQKHHNRPRLGIGNTPLRCLFAPSTVFALC